MAGTLLVRGARAMDGRRNPCHLGAWRADRHFTYMPIGHGNQQILSRIVV
jgi:hypothetical protein